MARLPQSLAFVSVSFLGFGGFSPPILSNPISSSFLYVESNTGESSGGHSALRFGDKVYHLQYSFRDSIFHIIREDWKDFRWHYGIRENRPIHELRFALSEKFRKEWQSTWDERRLRQRIAIRKRYALDEIDLYNKESILKIEGLAYVKIENSDWLNILKEEKGKKESNPIVQRIQERVAYQLYGGDLSIDLENWLFVSLPVSFEEKSKAKAKLNYLQTKWEDPQLDGLGRLVLAIRIHSLRLLWENGVWAIPKVSVATTEETIFPDVPEDTQKEKKKEILELFEIAKREFFHSHGDNSWAEWERRISLVYWELEEDSSQTEWLDGPHLAKSFRIEDPLDSYQVFGEIANEVVPSWDNLRGEYSYHLLFQNCTSELFRILEEEVNKNPNWKKELKTFQKPNLDLSFVPFVAFGRAKEIFPIQALHTYPSLHQMLRKEKPSIANSMTVTSNIYKINPYDTHFLFFTDESIWTRPLLGFGNLLYGIALTGYGTMDWIWTKGKKRTLQRGLLGIFFSFPEVVFFNIRKGTFPYATAKDMPQEDLELNP